MKLSSIKTTFLLSATFLPTFGAHALPARIAAQLEDAKSATIIAVLDENLDLATRLERESTGAPPALVPLAPAIVVGEGADQSNHTFVRVLNRYGIAQISFLAFAPDVRGGVQVAAGRDKSGAHIIAATPLGANLMREVRLFNALGGRVGAIAPSVGLKAPYRIASADFLPNIKGGELAVAGSGGDGNSTVLIFDFAGILRKTIEIHDAKASNFSMASVPEKTGARLALYFPDGKMLCEINPAKGAIARRVLPVNGARKAVYPTTFAPNHWLASGPEPLLSTVENIGANETKTVDVGQHENEFWITAVKHGVKTEGIHVKNAEYAHRRVEGLTPLKNDPQLARSENPRDWQKWIQDARNTPELMQPLADLPRTLWEPTFTHRMNSGSFDKWAAIKDEATGLPKYLGLTRKNNPSDYGEFKTQFTTATYALGMPELDRLYLLPLRGFLDALAVRYRENPERVISVEPNHEHEIAVREDGTFGDYNPAMIRGFKLYLQNMSGLDEAGIKARYGLPLTQMFDAPRNEVRGIWDAYDETNPFFMAWLDYNRYVINRRLADTFASALLAGFPPEIIKSHQIPDTFAIGVAKGYETVRDRITPIDYAMSAGVGFGYTRYNVWFTNDEQVQKAARTSGFDSVTVGEYQALTPQQKPASDQLKYMFDNGVSAVNAMKWPQPSGGDKFNPTMAGAIEDLIAQDQPRPGVTGGVGQIEPFTSADGKRRFDVAAIGTGPNQTGLLKSLNADGTWEGSVYAVPFRTAIDVETLPTRQNIVGGVRHLSVGPLDKLDGGEQIEITLRARSQKGGIAKFALRKIRPDGTLGQPLSGTASDLKIGAGTREVRLITRSQLPADGIVITLDAPATDMTIDQVVALRENEQIARPHRGVKSGQRHKGGVTFALLH